MSETDTCIEAKVPGPRWLLARLRGGYVRAVVKQDGLSLERARGKAPVEMPAGKIDSLTRVGPWFRHRLVIESSEIEGEQTEIGLWRGDAEKVVDALLSQSNRLACEVEPILAGTIDYLSGEQYRRRSTRDAAYIGLPEAIAKSTGRLVRARLSEPVQRRWEYLRRCGARVTSFEQAREDSNDTFVDRTFPLVTQQVEHHFDRAPTEDQARAIATDEDATLVLAGAGSGKTTVILGKLAHLIEQGVPPSEILVLAFNTKAAEEVKERLPLQLDGVDVSTFHSFGLRVVSEAEGRKPSVSPLAENDGLRRATLQGYLRDLLVDPVHAADLQMFLLNNLGEYASPFDFDSMGDYLDHVRRAQLTTLNGERVNSFEELEIANFMALNGIKYEYEAPYRHDTATSVHRQYQPDFYLPDYDLFIEHFGIDADGWPPVSWGEQGCKLYLDGIEWKRKTHAKHGTNLIETYSWQRSRGILTSTLRHLLEQRGVKMQPRRQDDLLRRLEEMNLVSQFVELLDSFLQHVKTAGLNPNEVRETVEAIEHGPPRERADLFLPIFFLVLERYDKQLRTEGIDFHDMINLAVDNIEAGRWRSPYRYVLVDEVQDIALNRMKLIAALREAGPAYFLVGDDWQAINRFAGSDLRLLRDAEKYLGFVRERHLARTFRFGPVLQAVSSAFVKRNPTQSQREQEPAQVERERGVVVAAVELDREAKGEREEGRQDWRQARDSAIAKLVEQIVTEVKSEDAGREASILLLGRYRFSEPSEAVRSNGMEFSTVHRAKGREADFVIVLDLRDTRYGFPAQIADDPLLSLVAPQDDDYEFAEERRLFYVAMTRARRGVFLVADANRPSRFVRELLRDHGETIQRIGELAMDRSPLCALCKTGVLRRSRTGKTLRCINSECPGRAVACECGRGFRLIDQPEKECTVMSCAATYASCPACDRGVMIRRVNRANGAEFWSCSEWVTMISCTWTQDLDPVAYPSWRCPRCKDGVVRAVNGQNGMFWGCNGWNEDPPCTYRRSAVPSGPRALFSQR